MPSGPKRARPQIYWHRSSLHWFLVALPMAREGSSGGSFIIIVFLLLSYSCGTQMNECFAKSKCDRLLFTFLFVFVSPVKHCSLENFSGPWHVIAMDF
jgi:hypothetical protein